MKSGCDCFLCVLIFVFWLKTFFSAIYAKERETKKSVILTFAQNGIPSNLVFNFSCPKEEKKKTFNTHGELPLLSYDSNTLYNCGLISLVSASRTNL